MTLNVIIAINHTSTVCTLGKILYVHVHVHAFCLFPLAVIMYITFTCIYDDRSSLFTS